MPGAFREEIEEGLDELEAAVVDWSRAEEIFARVLEPLLEHEGYEVSRSVRYRLADEINSGIGARKRAPRRIATLGRHLMAPQLRHRMVSSPDQALVLDPATRAAAAWVVDFTGTQNSC